VSEASVVAVVTGAGRGVGRAVALRLADRGCDVALLARTVPEIEEVASQVVARGRRAMAIRCDVASASEVTHAASRVRLELGVARVVVSNAGLVRRALVVDTKEEDWDRVIEVNLKGAFLVARAWLPQMIHAKRGRFVAVGSISSTLGTATQSAYCSAKWGLVGFVKSLAEELRGGGVQAMSVLPGSVDTAMLHGSGFAPQMTADEVANLVAYAALDAPDAMNGSAIEMFGP
jgi:NAD(P)-dependent dehydrogenase (short-subunit alcohol dehydrogenase family)